MNSVLKNLRQSLCGVITIMTASSCGGLKTAESLNEEGVSFLGITGASLDTEGKLIVSWDNAKTQNGGEILYDIYFESLDEERADALLAKPALQAFTLEEGRTSKTVLLEAELSADIAGQLLAKVSGENSYTITQAVPPSGAYAILVKASSASGDSMAGPFPTLVLSTGPLGAFEGCVSAEAVSSSEVKIDFTYPDNVDKITIYRDDKPIYEADTPQTSYFDRQAAANQSYVYTCEANIGDQQILGSKSLSVITPDPLEGLSDYQGCVTGVALDASQIQLDFEFPDGVDRVGIVRNGNEVFTATSENAVTTFIDSGLSEGNTYSYKCYAYIGDESQLGSQIVTLSTLTSNPPTFAGITSATNGGTGTALLTWGVSTGVPVENYKIYGKAGSGLAFSSDELLATVTGTLATTVSGIGDELAYTYGVLACSAADVCAGHSSTQTLALPDSGAPTTTGVSAVSLVNSEIILTIPYDYSDGAVAKRKIYQRTGATAGTNIADYTLVKTEAIAAPYTTMTTSSTISTVAQNTTYHFIVRDEDPTGNESTNTNSVTISISDLTPPAFPVGIQSLIVGTAGNEETMLQALFTAIEDETANPTSGADEYVIYTKTGGGDACADGTEHSALTASSYTNGVQYTVPISGLDAKTSYEVCIKARDSVGNISATTNDLNRSTLDTTAPSFDGIQSITYNNSLSRFEIIWNPSLSSDVDSYSVKLWKNIDPSTVTDGDTTPVVKDASSFTNGFNFTTSTFTYIETDTVYAIVNACDSAQTIPDGTKNCSNFALTTGVSAVVPDITAPVGFAGISSADSTSEGQVTAIWNAPASWADYAGFFVYDVDTGDSSLTQMKNCPCTDGDCATNPLLSCTVAALDANRVYRLHVRAYDAVGNVTSYVATTVFVDQLSDDASPPSFAGTPLVSLSGTDLDVSWTAATDNQYTGAGETIAYSVYRKTGSDFADTDNPIADADGSAAIGTTTSISYTDSTISDGQTYYYVVCAADGFTTPNVTCSPSKDFSVDDITAPTITGLAATFTNSEKTAFTVDWTIDDNITADGSLTVNVYRKLTNSKSDMPAANGTYRLTDVSGNGVETLTHTDASYQFYNYVVTVTDAANNISTEAEISVLPASPSIVNTNILASYDAAFYAGESFPAVSGSWPDLTGNGNTGTLSGGASWSGDGVTAAYSLDLDGVDALVDLGDISSSATFSFDFWAASDTPTNAEEVLFSNGGLTGNGIRIQQSPLKSGHYNALVGNYDSVISSLAPIAHYKLDETSGTTFTDETGNFDGTYEDSPTLNQTSNLPGVSGSNVEFNTSTTIKHALVGLADTLSGDNSYSISMWANLATTSSQYWALFGKNGTSFNLYVHPTGPQVIWQNGGQFSFSDFPRNEWFHIVAVKSDATNSGSVLYINGVLEVPASGTGNNSSTITGDIAFGGKQGSSVWTAYWQGNLDDIAVFDYDLTAEQVSRIYLSGMGCHSPVPATAGAFDQLGAYFDGSNFGFTMNGAASCELPLASSVLESSTNESLGASASNADNWDGSLAQARFYSAGDESLVHENFSETANTFRETPLLGVVTEDLVLQLDAANAVQGMRANADNSCDASVKWFDLSGQGNDGTLTNFSSCGDSTGWNGDGSAGNPFHLVFDSNNVVDIPSISLGSTYTIEFWLKYTNTYHAKNIFAGSYPVQITYNKPYLNNKSMATGPFNKDLWHHYVLVLNGGSSFAWVNGSLASGTAGTVPGSLTLSQLGAASSLYEKQIGYAAAYDQPITTAQADQNFRALADRFRNDPLTDIVKDGLVMQLDAANAKDNLRANSDGTCSATTWPDLSGNANDGILTNFASCGASSGWNGDGSVGDPYRLEFDNDDDYVDLGNLSISTSHTIETWINRVSGTGFMEMGSNRAYFFGGFYNYRPGGGFDRYFTIPFPSGSWDHFVTVIDIENEVGKVYENGTEIVSSDYSSPTFTSFNLEKFGDSLGSGYNGSLAYFATYNRALSVSEVSQNCNALEYRFTSSDDICSN